jgi:hypothetical protein
MILAQRSFARGVNSSYLYARPDLVDVAFGARTIENMVLSKEGVPETRAGFAFIDECRDPSTEKRLIPFVFSTGTGDTYAIEAGHEYMEFVRAGERILETAIVITAALQQSPCIITTSTAHGMSAGDHVYIEGVVGMTELNGRRYMVGTPSTTTLSLQDVHGANIDSTNFTAYSSAGTVARIYKIATEYQEDELQDLRFTQSADVMYIAHPNHAQRKLSRAGHASWTLADVAFNPTIEGPSAISVTAGGTGDGLTYKYTVTTVPYTGAESLKGYEAGLSITGVTSLNPITLTVTNTYSNGDEVYISGVLGMTELNGRRFTVSAAAAGSINLLDTDGSSYGTYTSGGTVYRTHDIITNADAPTVALPHVITWTAVANAARYAIYRELYGFWGFIGYSTSTTFSDPGITPDTSQGPPEYNEEFFGDDDKPSAVTIHQQRVVYGGSNNEPDTGKASTQASYDNFSTHTPLVDTDAVEFTLGSTEVNRIVHLVSLRRLIALTDAAEFTIEGNQSGSFTATSINVRPYTNEGASRVRPAIIGNDVIYVQARGNTLRSLYYDFSEETYTGDDLTMKASDLFRGYSIRDMAYAKIPDSLLWVCRSDGKLLSLTYNKKEKVLAWAGHTVGGEDVVVENVCSVPELDDSTIGGEDAVYAIVKRTVNERTVRYLERLQGRYVEQDARDRFTWDAPDYQHEFTYLDSHLTYDGRNIGAVTMTLSGSGETRTLTASSATFASTDAGNGDASKQYWLYTADGDLLRCPVTVYTSSTVVTVRPDRTVPASLEATATLLWSSAVKRVTGLWHLEGEEVSALGYGFVAADALTDDEPATVEDGAIVLSDYYPVIHVGLPYIQDLELNDIEFPEGESMYGLQKVVNGVAVYVAQTAGFMAGIELLDGDDVEENLSHAADAEQTNPDEPAPLSTGIIEVEVEDKRFTSHGRAVIRCAKPLPLRILAVTRVVEIKTNGR